MKVYLDTIGCRLNQAEIEAFARQLRAAGHTLVASAQGADLAVINTCTVTGAADADSRKAIRQAARLGARQIVVTGCWSTLKPQEAAALEGVSYLIANRDKESLVPMILGDPGTVDDGINGEDLAIEPVERRTIPGARLRTRAFIKVQDGCDNRCTFCITTLARGKGRSRPIAEVLADVHFACSTGEIDQRAREIVLTGVHMGSWGQDLSPRLHLHDLIKAILKESDAPRLRLSSLEPWDLGKAFFDLWEDPRLCRHQ